MPNYCDVALPVPLDRSFTYAVSGVVPEVGARVLVPFGGQRLMGVVVRVHDDRPSDATAVRPVQQVLDDAPLLPDELMYLAKWVAQYYVAPLGEVLRGMMPLAAEVRRHFVYRIAEMGQRILQQSVTLLDGSSSPISRRSHLPAEDQARELATLRYLADGSPARASALRAATGVRKVLLDGMVRKKWLAREALAEERDASRTERIAVLAEEAPVPRPNRNQAAILAEIVAAGGRMRVSELRQSAVLRELGVPPSALATLVRRGTVLIEDLPEDFRLGGLPATGKKAAHEHDLNQAQTDALASVASAMEQGGFKPILLYGVTGSGKTSVYFAAMQRALDAGKSALLLVPEIGLTPAMAGQMFSAFGPQVALLHSGLTPDERAGQWHRIRRGEARIAVGTRSAVFAPMVNLGLILVDEEHDGSYKQEETPRYHARDVAVMRAKFNRAVVVLGSATPSLESWANSERGRYTRIEMPARVMGRPLPTVDLVDMRAEFKQTGKDDIFSRQLVAEAAATLDRGEQVIILLNRRGYSFTVLCRSCGERIECENCAIAMTYHKPAAETDPRARAGDRLECHYCGYRCLVPKLCPQCASEHLFYLGAGSQQGEERLREIFPGARIARMDRDTVRGRGDIERLLARLHSGEINLLVGTQMIAKGHDIHGVTLAGVVGADSALGLPDFRAAERVFQLLTQVSGRAGRGELPGHVLVQTYHPEHYAIQCAAAHDYAGFVAKELQYRRWMNYPPSGVLANVIVQGQTLEEAAAWAATLGRWFGSTRFDRVRVLGPAAAPIARLKRIYRFHFVLKAERRDSLGHALRALLAYAETQAIPRRNLILDVDAVHLM